MSPLRNFRLPWRQGASEVPSADDPQPEVAGETDASPAPSPASEPAAPTTPAPAPEPEDTRIPHPPADPDADQVGALLETWRADLVALASDGPAHTFIELSAAHPTGVAKLYAGRPTRLSALVREEGALLHAQARARDVRAAQQQMIDAHGVGPVYLAIGTVSWTEGSHADNLRTGAAAQLTPGTQPMPTRLSGPALLCPVKLGTDDDGDLVIQREPTVALWAPLQHALTERGAGERIGEVLAETTGTHGFTTSRALQKLRQIGHQTLVSFDLYDSLTIGQYQHPVRDAIDALDAAAPELVTSPLLAALAGVAGAADAVRRDLPEAQPADRDPRVEHGVGDLDPLQHDALDAVAAGGHLFLSTPAGSTSAPTVLALLVDQILSGRSVTYVAGTTRHALALVAEAKRWGLQEMVADFTAPDWQRVVTRKVRQALAGDRVDEESSDVTSLRAELTKVRADLGGYMDRLHVRMAPWGVSAYDCLQVLTDLTSGAGSPRTRVRFDVDTLSAIAADGAGRARELIQAADTLGLIRKSGTRNAWKRVVIPSPDKVDETVSRVRALSGKALPHVRADIDRTIRETGLRVPDTLDEWDDQLQMLEGVRASLEVFVPEIFETSAADMVIATAPKKWREERSIHMKRSQRRRLTKQARDYIRPGRTVNDLHVELIRVQEQRQIWRHYSPGGGYPVLPDGLERMVAESQRLRGDIRALDALLGPAYQGMENWDLPVLAREVGALAADDAAIEQLPARVETIHALHKLGLDALIADLRERGVSADQAVAELDLAWWASALSQILRSDRRLATFDGQTLDNLIAKLRELDVAQVNSLAPQALKAFREQVTRRLSMLAGEGDALVRAIESGSVVSLLQAIGASSLGRTLVPLQIVPPALASQLAGAARSIDLVVFDGVEASPLGELAVPLGRAAQVVVIGDTRRSGEGLPALVSSLLPALTLPVGSARINGVVASFLAEHGYGSDIVAVAQPSHPAGLELVLVDGHGMPAPGANPVESTAAEVARVVDLVIAHALERPDDSLAVVAFNQRHAQRLSEAILSAVADSPAIDGFFRTDDSEPFQVTELSKCAGVTRDRIIFSLGYGKTPHGRVIHDFGEVAGENGPAYLVDALLATRGELSIVTSLDPDEVELRRVPTEGAHLLHDLLDRAKHEPKDRSPIEIASQLDEEEGAPDRLLVDLAERLYSLGLTVVPNVGPEEGLRIPLAIGHPDLPDELLVAVMTDNEAYVSERSLRRRDRHWAERLRDYGWVTHMVFSTAVFMDPQGEAERILEKVLDVVEQRQAPSPDLPDLPDQVSDEDFGIDQPGPQGAEPPAPPQRGERPPIARGLPLAAYSDDQLDDLLAWIRSDGCARGPADEVDELASELGLLTRGVQVDAILGNVVRRG